MKRSYSLVGMPVFVCATILAGSSQASARPIDPDAHYRRTPVIETPGPRIEVPVDDTATEVLQTGAGALGGAALTFAGFWLYKRRHPLPMS